MNRLPVVAFVVLWPLLTAGMCATGPTASIPVAVSCVPAKLEPAPKVETPEDLAKLDGPARLVHVTAAYLALFSRSLKTEPVIANCR